MRSYPFAVLRDYNKDIPRDPVSIATLIAPTIMAAGGVAAFAVTTAVFLATTALTSYVMSALGPKPPPQPGIQANIKDSAANGDIVYGRVRKGGVITFLESTGSDDVHLHMILVLAAHEVDAIEDIYIDDKVVTIDSTGLVTGNRWKGRVRIFKFLGAPGQLGPGEAAGSSSFFTVASPDANFRGDGLAYLYIRLAHHNEVFKNGIPLFTAIVRGKRVYDPRTGLTAYSNNAALCIRDYLLDQTVGAKALTSEVDNTNIATQANLCDVAVPLAEGGTQPRYNINGVLTTGETPKANLEKMLAACAGNMWWSNGTFKLKVGAWTAPVKTLTLDDFRSGITLNTRTPLRDSFNEVKAKYVSETADWIVSDMDAVTSTTFLAEDGGRENTLDLELGLTTSHARARRISKLTMFRAREQRTLTAEFGYNAFDLEVGDNVYLTIARYGWTNKTFEVISWNLILEPSSGATVEMTLQETSEAAFAHDAEEDDIIENDSNLPDPTTGLVVTGLSRTNQVILGPDGTLMSNAVLTWTATTGLLSHYEVRFRRSGTTAWDTRTTQDTSITINGLIAGADYDFEVRAISVSSYSGDWSALNNQIAGSDAVAPAIVADSGWTATGNAGKVDLAFVLPTDDDFSHVNVYENTVADSSTATLIARTAASTVSLPKIVPSSGPMPTYYYWLKSVDYSGNESAFSSQRSATIRGFTADDVSPEAFSANRAVSYTYSTPVYNDSSSSLVTLESWSWTMPFETRYLFLIQLSSVGGAVSNSEWEWEVRVNGVVEKSIDESGVECRMANNIFFSKVLSAGTHTFSVRHRELNWNNTVGITSLDAFCLGSIR